MCGLPEHVHGIVSLVSITVVSGSDSTMLAPATAPFESVETSFAKSKVRARNYRLGFGVDLYVLDQYVRVSGSGRETIEGRLVRACPQGTLDQWLMLPS